MVARAYIKYLRISPKKVAPVAELIKGKDILKAQGILQNMNKKGARLLYKALNSAIYNAKNKGFKEEKLFISKVVTNAGPVLKRWRAASFGRATMIRRRTSHVLIELDSSEKILEKVGK
ncbi:MAG: 50S ribosomal protein L22 [Candidatus Omnitrophota bacterium]|mgnify:CR=1 FL=1|nr:MAG: 50S ribosomal protein L22 [Candidatus Omnitrophota bacterium]HDN85627.1 50S ribosomal protein L22 [Candidatus Omnitrophota bacterium]